MALRVVHTFGKNAGAARTLKQDVVRLGRARDNDITFDADDERVAGRHHAELRREGDAWFVVDMTSQNGTFYGGNRITRREISTGDELTFGEGGPRVRVTVVPDEACVEDGYTPTFDDNDPAPPTLRRSQAPASSVPLSPRIPAPPVSRVGGPPPAPPAGAVPGSRTITEMISNAIRQNPVGAYIDDRVSAARREHRQTVRLLTALLAIALVCMVGLLIWNARSQASINRLEKDLAGVSARSRVKPIGGAPAAVANDSLGRQLYEKYKKGIFMLSANGQGFCTAFAVRPNVLATNAHCAEHAEQAGSVTALENEGRGRVSFRVTSSKAHPWFKGARSQTVPPDVGVVYIQGKVAVVLALATPQELTHLGAGDDLYMLGFPGRLMDAQNPAATFLATHVNRVANPHGQPAAFAQSWLIEHDAQTTPGTSGSPMFDAHGKVVAINAGSYTQRDQQEGQTHDSPYKIAVRIDLLNMLLQ